MRQPRPPFWGADVTPGVTSWEMGHRRGGRMKPQTLEIDRMSVEVTNRCAKACQFCYNHSQPEGDTRWTADELVTFVSDCAAHGVKAVSFGGGEPLQYPELFDMLVRLRGALFRSLTTNGLLLTGETLDRLIAAAPDKVHLSIHFPERSSEVERVIRQVHELAARGIRSGINFLVARSNLDAARRAAAEVRRAGIDNRSEERRVGKEGRSRGAQTCGETMR